MQENIHITVNVTGVSLNSITLIATVNQSQLNQDLSLQIRFKFSSFEITWDDNKAFTFPFKK